MTFASAKEIQLSDKQWPIFTGGIIDNSTPFDIPYKNTPYARNFRVNGRGISICPGFYQFGDSLVWTGTPLGIAPYYRSNPTNDRIVTRFTVDGTHKLVSIHPDTGAQTSISTGSLIGTDTRMSFVSSNDSLYCMNGVDPLAKLTDTTYAAVNTALFNITYNIGFNGTFTVSGTETAKGWLYYVEIDWTTGTNTFKWQYNGGAFTTGVAITGSAQTLTNGVSVTFQNTTGHTLGASATIRGSLRPAFGTVFDNSMFVSGDPNYPNTMWKSVSNSESFGGTGSDKFSAQYPITGLATAGQTLYVFTKNTVDMINNNSIRQVGSSLVYTSVPLEANEGAVVNSAIAVYGHSCYYLSASNKIKMVAPNSSLYYDVVDISHRPNRGIDKTMATLHADQSKAFCYVIPEKGLIKWHLRSKASTYNDVCVIYSTIYDEFMVDTNRIFYAGCNYNTKNYTVSQLEPKVYRDEEGQTNDDSAIQFRYKTKKIDLGITTVYKEIWQARTWLGINQLASVIQNIYVDGNLVNSRTIDAQDIPIDEDGIGTLPVGTFAIGEESVESAQDTVDVAIVIEKGDLQVRGKYVEVEWVCSSQGAQILLQQFVPRIQVLDQLTSSTR